VVRFPGARFLAKKDQPEITTKSEENYGKNVIGIPQGGDPVLKSEYIMTRRR